MLTKKKVLSLSLTLAKAGDSDLLHGEEILAGEALDQADKARVSDIGEIVHALCKDYSYVRSVAFEREIAGKSESVTSMKVKIESSPVKKKERSEALFAAIRSIMEEPEAVLALVRQDQRASVDRLVAALGELTIPRM